MANTITEGCMAVLYISGAASAIQMGEAMTPDATDKIFTIANAAKSVWDPTLAVTLHWTAGPTGTITQNRLTGQVYSTVDETANEPLTADIYYRPMAAMLYAKDFSLSIKPKIIETTALNCTTPPVYVTRQRSLSEVSGTIGDFFTPDDPTASLAIPDYFADHLTDATVFALKFYMNANYSLLAWVTPDVETIRANLGNVLEETVTFRGVADADNRVVSQL